MAKKTTTDSKTLDLIKEVNRQKAEISRLERPNYKTNMSFSYNEGKTNETYNLNVCGDVQTLLKIAAFLHDRQVSYAAAIAQLQVEDVPKFTWSGYSALDWLEDIKTRISKVQITSKKQKLETLENRLNAIISPELRAELELEAIASELG